jgi:hypothetical protein
LEEGSLVRWSDVAVDDQKDAVCLRREMAAAFATVPPAALTR